MADSIKCSVCKCKHVNDDEHIQTYFGYNARNERYKTCLKCRTKKKVRDEKHKGENHEYQKKHHQKQTETQTEDEQRSNKHKKSEYDKLYNQTLRKTLNNRKLKTFAEQIEKIVSDGCKYI